MTLPRCGALAALAFALACDSGTITAGEPLEVVAAFRDVSTEFDRIVTYALPDSVVHLTADHAAATPTGLTREHDDRVLERLLSHLGDRGYVREPEPDRNRADVVVLVSVIAATDFVSWASYPWFEWWGFFPGFAFGPFDTAWGVEYPWSDDVVAFEYDIGTIVIEMIDARSIDEPNQRVQAVWSGAISGILRTDSVADETRILRSIDEVFALSPYLRRQP